MRIQCFHKILRLGRYGEQPIRYLFDTDLADTRVHDLSKGFKINNFGFHQQSECFRLIEQTNSWRPYRYVSVVFCIYSVPIVTVSSPPYKTPVGVSGRTQCQLFSLMRQNGSWTTDVWSRCRRCGGISEHFRVLAAPISTYTWARAGALVHVSRSRCCCPPSKYHLKYLV